MICCLTRWKTHAQISPLLTESNKSKSKTKPLIQNQTSLRAGGEKLKFFFLFFFGLLWCTVWTFMYLQTRPLEFICHLVLYYWNNNTESWMLFKGLPVSIYISASTLSQNSLFLPHLCCSSTLVNLKCSQYFIITDFSVSRPIMMTPVSSVKPSAYVNTYTRL